MNDKTEQVRAAEAAYRQRLSEEFPEGAAAWDDPLSRRNFLRLMGASLALAGLGELAGCAKAVPSDEIVPYTNQPEQMVPGRPMFFSSTMPFEGYGRGVLVVSREGRPIKIEGNPDHPASLGGTDVFMQASVLDLYDQDRATTITQAGQTKMASDFQSQLADRLTRSNGGNGVRLLTRRITSPTLMAQLAEFRQRYPRAKWHEHDPMIEPGGAAWPGTVFEQPVDVLYDLSAASVIVSLDSDFLIAEPGSLQYARQFSDARRVRKANLKMSRTYVTESALTITGSIADHRLPMGPTAIVEVARALAMAVGVTVPGPAPVVSAEAQKWIVAAAGDLKAAGGAAVVIPGRYQPPAVHALAHQINRQLGADGKTVRCIEPVALQGAAPLSELVADLRSGAADTVLILDGNPAYDAPADLDFAAALSDLTQRVDAGGYVGFTAHLGGHFNETSYACQWHLPMAHWLESWGDLRAFDGTTSLIQPLIAPLYNGLSPWEFAEMMLGRPGRGGYSILQDHWRSQVQGDFNAWWMQTLQKGVIDGTAAAPRSMPAIRQDLLGAPQAGATDRLEVVVRPDPAVWAGEFTNNAWLQELPRPFTKLTWDNALGISPGLAKSLVGGQGSLATGDVLRLTVNGRTLEGPVVLVPGQADNVIWLTLGYGRERGGKLLQEQDRPRGYNAYSVRTTTAFWCAGGIKADPTGKTALLALTQNHHAMAALDPKLAGDSPLLKPQVVAKLGMSDKDLELVNRKLIRTVTLQQYRQKPRFMDELAPDEKRPLLSLFVEPGINADLQWGMVIDQTACIGCNACVIGCQAENNIPVVGKDEVLREREMHWIRIDDYFDGSEENPTVYHQPVPCMHCEDAPCEIVCPVAATTHSPEGLNEMTYNRCVGTRYCSNNCPYKVRRFNFLLYSDYAKDSRSLQYNPDVSVRSRGVMEKCTYCVQRIDRTRVEMEREVLQLQVLADGARTEEDRQRFADQARQRGRDVVNQLETACQQACPTRAIIFGDIRDRSAEVAKLKTEPANYDLLRSLTTKPRTSYLARVSNPNPSLAEGVSA